MSSTESRSFSRTFRFAPFSLDLGNASLEKDGESLVLTPRAFALLRHLVERSPGLVTKEELLDVVWEGAIVGDAVIRVCMGEVRKVLGDNPDAPRYIETVHRKGYRFIADVTSSQRSVGSSEEPASMQGPAAEVKDAHSVSRPQQLAIAAGDLLTLAHEQEFELWKATGAVTQGWALARTGESEKGQTFITDAMESLRIIGLEIARSYYELVLADIQGRVGKRAEALAALAKAHDVMQMSGERFCEAELYRIRGELMLAGITKERSQEAPVQSQKVRIGTDFPSLRSACSPCPRRRASRSFTSERLRIPPGFPHSRE